MSAVRFRLMTKAEFTAQNPVLAPNELGIESDSNPSASKVGNGTDTWNALPYQGAAAIANDLVTTDQTKALGAAEGPILKAMIDALTSALGNKADSSSIAEAAQDAIAAAITAGTQTGITITYDDANNKFNFTVTAGGFPLANNLTTTVAGASALDALQGKVLFDSLATKITDQGSYALTGATVLYKDVHGNRPGTFSGASANLSMASDAAATAAGHLPWLLGDSSEVATLPGSAGVPTITTPDGKFNVGSETRVVGALCKGSNIYSVTSNDPAIPATGAVPVVVSGLSPVGSTLVAAIAAGWDTVGNWTRAGTNISGATVPGGYVTTSADAGTVVTWKPTNIAGFIPAGVSVAASAPGQVTALTAGTATTATQPLTWTAPASTGGSAITDYLVEYKLHSSGTWLTFSDGVSTSAAATVTGLAAGSSYDFRVSAINAIGTGASSSVLTASTASGGSLSITNLAATITSAFALPTPDGTANWYWDNGTAGPASTNGGLRKKTPVSSPGPITNTVSGFSSSNPTTLTGVGGVTVLTAEETQPNGSTTADYTAALGCMGYALSATAGVSAYYEWAIPLAAGVPYTGDAMFQIPSAGTLQLTLDDASATDGSHALTTTSTPTKVQFQVTALAATTLRIRITMPNAAGSGTFKSGVVTLRT